VQDFAAGKRGRIVIAAAPSMSAAFVPAVIAAFAPAHPLVDIELHDRLSEDCVAMLRSGAADLALAPYRPGAEDLTQVELFKDPLVVVCPEQHALAKRSQVRWRDVQAFPHIVMTRSGGVRQLVDAEYARQGVRLSPVFEVTHVGTLLGLIAAGLGVGELPLSLAQSQEASGLVYRRISNASAARTICAMTLERASRPAPLEPFIALCRSLARQRTTAQASARART
jgi:LysR family carnitine catabolism transcriptional activator